MYPVEEHFSALLGDLF